MAGGAFVSRTHRDSMGSVTLYSAAEAATRLSAASSVLDGLPPAAEALLLGGTRDAVDDFARDRTSRLGSTFGLHRFSLPQFARPA